MAPQISSKGVKTIFEGTKKDLEGHLHWTTLCVNIPQERIQDLHNLMRVMALHYKDVKSLLEYTPFQGQSPDFIKFYPFENPKGISFMNVGLMDFAVSGEIIIPNYFNLISLEKNRGILNYSVTKEKEKAELCGLENLRGAEILIHLDPK